MDIPPELERALYGFMASNVLFAGDSSGVFAELIQQTTATAGEIAQRLELSTDAVDRLLTAAVSLGLVKRTAGAYTMQNNVLPFLDPNHLHYQGGIFRWFERLSTRSFSFLGEALRDGQPQWRKVVGNEASSPFEFFAKDEGALHRFATAMWSLSYSAAKELVLMSRLEKCQHLVDVGGGSGSFAIAALQQWKTMRATVFDLPGMRGPAECKAREHGVEDRFAFVAGDFFVDSIPKGDVCALGYVLSDWDDARCIQILSTARCGLPLGGAIVILERLFDDERNGPAATALMDLCMMLEPGGRHRTSAEYFGLLESAGLKPSGVRRSSREKHIIFGSKL